MQHVEKICQALRENRFIVINARSQITLHMSTHKHTYTCTYVYKYIHIATDTSTYAYAYRFEWSCMAAKCCVNCQTIVKALRAVNQSNKIGKN